MSNEQLKYILTNKYILHAPRLHIIIIVKNYSVDWNVIALYIVRDIEYSFI